MNRRRFRSNGAPQYPPRRYSCNGGHPRVADKSIGPREQSRGIVSGPQAPYPEVYRHHRDWQRFFRYKDIFYL